MSEKDPLIEADKPPPDPGVIVPNRPPRPGDEEVASTGNRSISNIQTDINYGTTPKLVSAPIPDITVSIEAEVDALKARDLWMRVALRSAVNRGFVNVDQDQNRFLGALPTVNFESPEAKAVVLDLIKMKQDLAKAKVSFDT